MLGGASCGPSASLPCAASIDGEMGLPPAAATRLVLARSSCPTCKQAPCTPANAVSTSELRQQWVAEHAAKACRPCACCHDGPLHEALTLSSLLEASDAFVIE